MKKLALILALVLGFSAHADVLNISYQGSIAEDDILKGIVERMLEDKYDQINIVKSEHELDELVMELVATNAQYSVLSIETEQTLKFATNCSITISQTRNRANGQSSMSMTRSFGKLIARKKNRAAYCGEKFEEMLTDTLRHSL